MAIHAVLACVLTVALATLAGIIGGWQLAPVGGLAGAAYYAVTTRRYRRRRSLLAQPMSAADRAVLETKVAFYRRLDAAEKLRFEDDIRIFLNEQTITGLRGHTVSAEARILIAASAAMLTFGLPSFEWPHVRDIVVYPRSFDENYDEAGGNIAGMVHLHGPILFSLRDLQHGFQRADGHHVGIHEMAHVMDMLDGAADGIPGDLPWVSTAPWVKIVASRLRRVRRHPHHDVLRDYAGTNEAELFAVAVEVFFERPDDLHAKDPKLFAMLVGYFNQDPRRPGHERLVC